MINFKAILKFINVAIPFFGCYLIITFGENNNINIETILLLSLLCIQIYSSLSIKILKDDPFVLIMGYYLTFYYALRIITLTVFPFSHVFLRFDYDVNDTNYSLLIILAINLFIYTGFYFVKNKRKNEKNNQMYSKGVFNLLSILLVTALGFNFFGGYEYLIKNQLGLVSIVFSIVQPNVILMLYATYFFYYKNTITRLHYLIFGALLVLFVILYSISGSRSSIILIFELILIINAAIYGCFYLRKRNVLLAIGLIPIIFSIYVFSTIIRENSENKYNILDSITSVNNSNVISESYGRTMEYLPHIFARAGFFDFTSEIIAHKNQYSTLFSIESYAMSFVDNLFTPGFDIFDYPKIGNSLFFYYEKLGIPKKSAVADNYQSDQIGIYAEYFSLFGILALPLAFIFSFLIKYIYVKIGYINSYASTYNKVITLYFFTRMFNSFGIDWAIAEIIPFYIIPNIIFIILRI
jgi:hypothetical protein